MRAHAIAATIAAIAPMEIAALVGEGSTAPQETAMNCEVEVGVTVASTNSRVEVGGTAAARNLRGAATEAEAGVEMVIDASVNGEPAAL